MCVKRNPLIVIIINKLGTANLTCAHPAIEFVPSPEEVNEFLVDL